MDTIKNTIGNAMESLEDAMGSEHHSQHQSTPYRHSTKTENAPVAVLDVRTGNESHALASGKTTCSCNGNENACSCPPGTCACAGCGQRNKKAGPMKGMGTRPLDQGAMSSSKMGSGAGSSERAGCGNEGCRVMGRGECDCEPGTCAKGAASKGGMSGQSSMSGQMGQGGHSYASMAGKGRGADQVVLNRD